MENLVTVTTTVTTTLLANPISRRAELKTLSNLLKATALENQTSINAALVFFYSEQTGVTSQDFKTLEEWNRTGYIVKKGEKSFSIWGQLTTKTINLEEGRIAGEPEVIEYYPMVALFSIDQVTKITPYVAKPSTEDIPVASILPVVTSAEETQKTKPSRKGKKESKADAQA